MRQLSTPVNINHPQTGWRKLTRRLRRIQKMGSWQMGLTRSTLSLIYAQEFFCPAFKWLKDNWGFSISCCVLKSRVTYDIYQCCPWHVASCGSDLGPVFAAQAWAEPQSVLLWIKLPVMALMINIRLNQATFVWPRVGNTANQYWPRSGS